MNIEEYAQLLKEIQGAHTTLHLRQNKMRMIKYVSADFDTRDGKVYRLSLREWFNRRPTIFNRPDFDKILSWLREEV